MSSIKASAGPVQWLDPGDLLALIYDRLLAAQPSRLELDDWYHEKYVQQKYRAEARTIALRGNVRFGAAKLLLESTKGAFIMLLALDHALRYVDPRKNTASAQGLEVMRLRWRDQGRLNTDQSNGAVLFRRGYPARPQGVLDGLEGYLRYTVRVPARDVTSGTVHEFVPGLIDFDLRLREDDLLFGCVTFVGALSELEVRRIDQGSGWYAIHVADDDELLWESRVTRALVQLDSAGVHVGVLPELVLTDRLLRVWQTAVRRIPAPDNSKLTWLLVGSGPLGGGKQPPNQAVMVDRHTGDVVFTQNKLHPFTLGDNHIRKWQLSGLGPGPLGEWMAEGRSRSIVETAVGRFVVCICEDLGRVTELTNEIAPWGVSHVLVPILAEPIRPYHWEHNSAERLTNQIGSGVVIANSRAIRVLDEADEEYKASTSMFVGVRPSSADGGHQDWCVEVETPGLQEDPTAVSVGALPCG